MADVFISYSQRSVEPTKALAAELQTRGFEVWWDTSLTSGQRFDEVIRDELEAAEAAIVIWTPESINSRYVKMEAGIAYAWEKLLTVRTSDLPPDKIPEPFRGLHADVVTDIDRIIVALGQRNVQPKSATKRKKMTSEEILYALGQLDSSLPSALEAWFRKCQMDGFRVVTNRSFIIKSTIPNFGDVNFGTLFPDGKLQTNYISERAERVGDKAIASDYLDGVAGLIDRGTVRRDGTPWNWRVEILGGELPLISSVLAHGDRWIELMKVARSRFVESAKARTFEQSA